VFFLELLIVLGCCLIEFSSCIEFLNSFLVDLCLTGDFKHCYWENCKIELLYWCCIQICSGVLLWHCGCSSCAVGAAQECKRPSCRVQEGLLCDLIVNFVWISGNPCKWLQGTGRSPSGWVNQYKNICAIFFSLSLLNFFNWICVLFNSTIKNNLVKIEEQPVKILVDFNTHISNVFLIWSLVLILVCYKIKLLIQFVNS